MGSCYTCRLSWFFYQAVGAQPLEDAVRWEAAQRQPKSDTLQGVFHQSRAGSCKDEGQRWYLQQDELNQEFESIFLW